MDPNKTVIGAPGAIPGATPGFGDPNRTVLGGAPPSSLGAPPNATTRMAPMAAPAPSGPSLTVDVIPGRTATMANGPARESFLLQLTAAGGDAGLGGFTPSPFSGGGSRTATNLCLVIDRSGSMEGPPLEAVKNACAYVVDMLGPNDTLSIVTFAENVEVLMPPQRVTQKDPIKRGIANLAAGNTTDFHGGITLGLQQLTQGVEGRRASRMIVLTDGDPTAGITEFAPITALATQVKNAGASLTLLGFGPDYNEELLAGMAKRASGNYYYIATAEMLSEVFRAEMAKTLTQVAQNAVLEVKLSRWVQLRAPQTLNEGTATIPLADLERGATLEQVLEFDFPNHPLGQYRIAACTLKYEDLATGAAESRAIDLTMEFTADASRYGAPVDPRVGQASQIAAASRAVEKTVMGLKTGVLSGISAMQELQKTQALLLSQGRADEAKDVTMALRALQTGDSGAAEKTLLGTVLNLDQGKK